MMHYPQPSRILLSPQPFYAGHYAPGTPDSNADAPGSWQDWLCGDKEESVASTSAGPTPSLIDDQASQCPTPFGDGYDLATYGQQDARGDHSAALAPVHSQAQNGLDDRKKVFVGGVPQEMTQAEFEAIFTQFGTVKKAWLQRGRSEDMPRNHRGFGFVSFWESSSVEKLLGNEFSRFISLWNGRNLEVKRALSIKDMRSQGGGTPQQSFTPMGRERSFPTDRFTSSRSPPHWHGQEELMPSSCGALMDNMDSNHQQNQPQQQQSPPPPAKSRQQTPAEVASPWMSEGLPMLPPSFPATPPLPAHLTSPSPPPDSMALTQGDMAGAYPHMHPPASPPSFWMQFEGSRQCPSPTELEKVLRQAMPDHYEE